MLARGAPCPWDHRCIRGIDLARAPLRYRGTGGALVRRLKFDRDPASWLYLSRAMANALQPCLVGRRRRAVLASVPLHPRKLRERGLDQAALLADGVAVRTGLRAQPRALARRRDTLPQGDPRVTSREANVSDAFVVRRPRRVGGRIVVLVDDVCTSGNTGRACALALRDAGATSVILLTAVRA